MKNWFRSKNITPASCVEAEQKVNRLRKELAERRAALSRLANGRVDDDQDVTGVIKLRAAE